MFIAYLGINLSSIKGFISITLCALASFSVFHRYPKHAIKPIHSHNYKQILITLLLGLGIGLLWGILNLFMSGQSLHFQPTLMAFLVSLSPAIFEEVCFRLLIFTFCLYLLKGEIRNQKESAICTLMMILPHVFIHTPDIFLSYGLINLILLSLIFGLPFALLQRKHDLTSAMIAHGLTDTIRFCFLGLPF